MFALAAFHGVPFSAVAERSLKFAAPRRQSQMATYTCDLCRTLQPTHTPYLCHLPTPGQRMRLEAARDTNGTGEVVASTGASGTAEGNGDEADVGKNLSAPKPPFTFICSECRAQVGSEKHRRTGIRQNLVEQDFCYKENQVNKDLMEAPQCHLLNRDGLDDRTPRRSQPGRHKSQELSFENTCNAFAEGPVCHEEMMDHQETKEEHLVIREREAGDYFGDPTLGMSRLTTLLAAQRASKLLGKRTQRELQDDVSPCPIAPKAPATTKSSGQHQLWEASEQPALSDAGRCCRPSTEQAQKDVLHNDSSDNLEPVMSKLVDLTIDPKSTKGCHVVPKYEQLRADGADVLEPVVRKVEDMQINPLRAERPIAVTGDEHKDTDSPNRVQ